MRSSENFRWTNWAGNHSCVSERYFEPGTEGEVREIVLLAARSKKKIRVAGSGHSFSPIVPSDDILISLKHFNKILAVGSDFVTCEPGITLRELYLALEQAGLSLPNFGVINKQTLAGALATGTHGSGKKYQSLSAGILSMRLVTGNGDVLVIDRKHEWWDAASVSLGLLGIVTQVTLKCEPLFYVRSEEEAIPFNDYLHHMDEWAEGYDYFKAWWFPHTDNVYTFKAQRIGKEEYEKKELLEKYSAEQKKRDREIDALTAPLFIRSLDHPEEIPGINKQALEHYFTPRTRIGTGTGILVHDETVPMIVSEFALPVASGKHKEALRAFHDRIEQGDHRLHFPVDLRYGAAESCWLSPAYERDSFYIGMCVREYRKPGIPAVMKTFMKIMGESDARPNWGKLFDLDAGALEKLFPRLKDMREVKKKADPQNIFSNRHLDAWLGMD